MESDYDKCLADNKRLGDKNKHLLAKTRHLQRVMTSLWNDNERFIADNIAKDICSFVLSSEKQVDTPESLHFDAEAEAFLENANVECTAPYDQPLAMAMKNIFEVNHEDAYDSDVDEGPNAAAAFMANITIRIF
ncbi:hypothetical protein Tco_0230483, partial [Tanacetum coccineum]